MTEAEIEARLAGYQVLIDLTKGHRYRTRETPTSKWEWSKSVSSVVNEMAKPALIDSAARLAAATGDPHAHRKEWGAKAVKGTDLHSLVEWECKIRRGDAPPLEQLAHLQQMTDDQFMAVARWRKWAKEADLKPLMMEIRVADFGLGYAGTLDLLAYHRGALKVIDWKTGSVWPEAHMQVAAYRSALASMLQCDPPAGLIVNVPRDGGDIQEHPCDDDIGEAMEAFKGLLAVVRWRSAFEKRKVA